MLMTTHRPRAIPSVLAFLVTTALAVAQTPAATAVPPTVMSAYDPAVIAALRESWPDHPEWVDMLADILQEAPLGPDFGWFRTAVTQTHFTWDATRDRFDSAKDGKISRKEFPGSDQDFARLDRDRDTFLTKADFDFVASSLAPSPGLMLFGRADRDANGKVTREEFEGIFRAIDSDNQGFLSQQELQDAFTMPARSSGGRSGIPSKAIMTRALFSQELGSLQPGPKLDESAPDFTLKTNDGTQEITLSKLVGPKPVVLIFGNFTCGPFRSHAGNFEKMYQRYKDRATFVMVYVREAHPTDGWRMESNDRVGVVTAQPKVYEERVKVAQQCGELLSLGFPMLVDTIDDAVGGLYSGMPGRFYVIDRSGKVAFKNGRGPYGFKPAELETSLVLLLQQQDALARAKTD